MVSINEFLEMQQSKATIVGYRTSLTQYFAFHNVDPDKYFDLYKKARTLTKRDEVLEKYKLDVSRYIAHMRSTGVAPKSIQCKSGAIRSYLLENHIDLGRLFWKRMKVTGQALTRDRIPTKNEIRMIVNHLDLLGRAVLFIQISTGMRLEDVQGVEIKNIDFTKTPVRVFYYCHKIRRWLYGFLTKEAVIVIQEWMKNRDAYLMEFNKVKYKLLPTKKRETKRKNSLLQNTIMKEDITFEDYCKQRNAKREGLILPITKSSIYYRYWNALDDAGLGEKDKLTGIRLLHDHTLRKYAYTQASRAVSHLVAEAIVGDTKGLIALETIYGHHGDNTDNLAQDFLKAEAELSLSIEVLPTTELEQVNQRLNKNEAKLEGKEQKLDLIQKANEDHFQIIQMLLGEIGKLKAEIDHRNKAIIDQRELEWQRKIEKEYVDKAESIRKFREGSQLILDRMVATGKSKAEIRKYKENIEHGIQLLS